MSRIMLTEAETAALIAGAVDGRTAPLAFGPGWVALDTTRADTRWALELLADLRGVPR